MKKTELFVETNSGKKVFFYGVVQNAFLTEFVDIEKTVWQLVLYNQKFVVYRANYAFYPATVVQQLAQQDIIVETYNVQQLDIETQQILLDLNTKP